MCVPIGHKSPLKPVQGSVICRGASDSVKSNRGPESKSVQTAAPSP